MVQLAITKRDGTKEPFNADKINRSIERACRGLTDPISMVTQIATETQLTLYDGITTEEMDIATINAAVQNIKEDIEYDKVGVRLLLKTVYRRVVGEYHDDSGELESKHAAHFSEYVKAGVASGILDTRMAEKFDLNELAQTLKIERDEIFTYAGLSTLMNRYALKDVKQKPAETPQYFFMRVAMGLSYNEKNPTAQAKKFYERMSQHLYVAGGSTNLQAGTSRPALSNCFLLQVEDDIDHIAKSVADVMKISKASGGIGVSVTKLRAAGSPLKSSNTVSSGPTPFAKIMDTAIRAIQRGGKKLGALCFYMENWHLDFPEFIDWKHNAGDDYLRMRTANTAVWISDEFMHRVERGDDWYMFDPKDVPDLAELYGQAFSKRYAEYVALAEAGKMRAFKKVPAREQWSHILTSLQSTSHPWLTWKDPINLRALNNNTGTIHMSNLCTEICLPQDKDNIAVCNLASLNLAAHIEGKQVSWNKLEESVRLAIRQLDNLIDINMLPIEEAIRSDKENRAVGLGVMGFSDALEQLGMPYESGHAAEFADRVFEFVSYMAIDESANLARERGSYTHFAGSRWAKGMVPVDTMLAMESDRGIATGLKIDSRNKQLNWDALRAKVKGGMRNATLMAVAPNANIGLVAGTTPGIDPRFAQVFSRNKISGKYMDINHNLVKDLKNMGLWDVVKDQIVEQQGDIAAIPEIPSYLKQIYKTSFTTSPYAFIEIAARAQKWVDQALSRNIYLENRDMDEMKNVYMAAWKRGLKTTYYLHMKPRHTAEQSTTNVNKGAAIGKRGFANVVATPVMQEEAPTLSPIQQSPVQVPEMVPVKNEVKPVDAVSRQEVHTPVPGRGFGAVAAQGALPMTPAMQQELPVQNGAMQAPVTENPKIGFAVAAATPISLAHSEAIPMPMAAPQHTFMMPQAAREATPSSTPLTANVEKKKAFVCPVDPAERAQCDSCQ